MLLLRFCNLFCHLYRKAAKFVFVTNDTWYIIQKKQCIIYCRQRHHRRNRIYLKFSGLVGAFRTLQSLPDSFIRKTMFAVKCALLTWTNFLTSCNTALIDRALVSCETFPDTDKYLFLRINLTKVAILAFWAFGSTWTGLAILNDTSYG